MLLGIFIIPIMGISVVQEYSEYEVKAAFLCNFAKFVEWPDNAFKSEDAPFVIGIIGKDPFGNILERTLKGRTLQDKKCEILRFNNLNDLGDCHMLFVSSSQQANITRIIAYLKGKHTLTVGDNIEQFCQRGGIINFSSKRSRYGFEINKNSAQRSKLAISSKLLALAQIVE